MRLPLKFLLLALVSFLTPFQPACGQSFLTNGLVAHYTFNGSAVNVSGNLNHGEATGAALAEDRFGVLGRAYKFTAPGDRISTASANGLPAGNDDFTVSFWVKLAADSGTHQIFVANSALEQFQIHMGPRDNGKAQIGVQLGATGAGYTDFIPWNLNRWYQIVVTKTGGFVSIYRDGSEASRQSTSLRNEADLAHRPLTFGYRPNDGRQFYGELDEIRVYSRALTAVEIADLYRIELGPGIALNKAVKPAFSDLVIGTKYQLQVSTNGSIWTDHGLPFSAIDATMVYPEYWDVAEWNRLFYRLLPGIDLANGLVAYYPFKGNPNDASAKANHGTAHSAALTADRFGRSAEAYHFNGIDSYIELPASDVFSVSTFSISLWFKASRLPDASDHAHEAAMLLSKARNRFELHLGSPPSGNGGIRFLPKLVNATTGQYWDAPSADVKPNAWRHVAAFYDDAAQITRLFLDGVELTTTHITGPDSEEGVTVPARLGMRYDATGPNTGAPFEGEMDSVRIYNRVLTTGEIIALGETAD